MEISTLHPKNRTPLLQLTMSSKNAGFRFDTTRFHGSPDEIPASGHDPASIRQFEANLSRSGLTDMPAFFV